MKHIKKIYDDKVLWPGFYAMISNQKMFDLLVSQDWIVKMFSLGNLELKLESDGLYLGTNDDNLINLDATVNYLTNSLMPALNWDNEPRNYRHDIAKS